MFEFKLQLAHTEVRTLNCLFEHNIVITAFKKLRGTGYPIPRVGFCYRLTTYTTP